MVVVACRPCGLGELIPLVRAEYLEMPGMRLTLAQASRLWNVDVRLCARALEELVKAGFLCRCGDSYGRAGVGRHSV